MKELKFEEKVVIGIATVLIIIASIGVITIGIMFILAEDFILPVKLFGIYLVFAGVFLLINFILLLRS